MFKWDDHYGYIIRLEICQSIPICSKVLPNGLKLLPGQEATPLAGVMPFPERCCGALADTNRIEQPSHIFRGGFPIEDGYSLV